MAPAVAVQGLRVAVGAQVVDRRLAQGLRLFNVAQRLGAVARLVGIDPRVVAELVAGVGDPPVALVGADVVLPLTGRTIPIGRKPVPFPAVWRPNTSDRTD